ncbi:MAG: hypothetical protein ABI999_17790 [Acidobacteriota bacterium]
MKATFIFVLAFLFCIALTAQTTKQSNRFSQFGETFRRECKDAGIVGGAFVFLKDGKTAASDYYGSANLEKLSGNADKGVEKILSAAATIDKIAGRVDSSTSKDELRQIIANTQNAARELVAATTRLRTLADSAGGTQSRLNNVIAQADSVFAKVNSKRGSIGMLVNDSRLYTNTDSLIMELRALVADVKKNPKKYVNVRVF